MTALVLAPHADDEVLGVGGTIASLALAEEPHPIFDESSWDVTRQECRAACDILGAEPPIFRELPAATLDNLPAWQINQTVAEVIDLVRPEELYVPFSHDLHRDHGAIDYAAAVAARPYLPRNRQLRRVLAYETLSETHLAWPYLTPAFQPTSHRDITEVLERKLDAMRAYSSQLQPDGQPRSIAALRALATLRGAHLGVAAAEAFVLLFERS